MINDIFANIQPGIGSSLFADDGSNIILQICEVLSKKNRKFK